ncbi:CPXCG motif-containing cysteine-rich protein, partial [uncultured Croceitalea sp.]
MYYPIGEERIYCWELISMVLDASVAHQVYVEDCEV